MGADDIPLLGVEEWIYRLPVVVMSPVFQWRSLRLCTAVLPYVNAITRQTTRRYHSSASGEPLLRGGLRGCRFSVGGAAHEVELGRVNGQLSCQFTLTQNLWHGVAEGPSAAPCSNAESAGKGKVTSDSNSVSQEKRFYSASSTARSAKEQFVVRCTGHEAFLRRLASTLQSGTIIELEGDLAVCTEPLKNGAEPKHHTFVSITQQGLQQLHHHLRVVHCGPTVTAMSMQKRINDAIFSGKSAEEGREEKAECESV